MPDLSTLCTWLATGLFSLTLTAQTYTGCVTDPAGDPLIGASVQVPHTTSGTVTDSTGCFTLDYPRERATLTIKYPGYATRTFRARAAVPLRVTLAAAPAALERVEETAALRTYRDDTPPSIRRATTMTTDAVMGYAAPASAPTDYGKSRRGEVSELPAAGQLTAGQLNDFGDWELWNDLSHEDLAEYRSVWGIYPENRYAVQLTFPNGHPAGDVTVKLTTRDGQVIWTARTDNQGRAELWRGLLEERAHEQQRLSLTAVYGRKTYELPTAHGINAGPNYLTLDRPCDQPRIVDVAFVVDATGSMGDEIRYLSSELLSVIERSRDSLADQELRLASVFYRDEGDDYVTRHHDFAAATRPVIDFIRNQAADGGGDTPEAVDAALESALDDLKWSERAAARLLFLVLDAPPHADEAHVARMRAVTARAAERGIRIVPVVCSGMDKSGEYLLRSVALATNGTYTFLTDDSGIGNPHLEPSTDAYEVEKLNDLLVRLIYQFGRAGDCAAPAYAASGEFGSPVEDAEDWKLYPNPTSGATTLDLPRAEGAVFLLDGLGKVLHRYAVTSERPTAQLGGLPSGVYYLRYVVGEAISTRRVVVERAR